MKFLLWTMFIVTAAAFFGCGGDGGDKKTSGSSNWDEMVWDQDTWG